MQAQVQMPLVPLSKPSSPLPLPNAPITPQECFNRVGPHAQAVAGASGGAAAAGCAASASVRRRFASRPACQGQQLLG